MSWNPTQYLQFEDQRLRPAIDLMMRVPDVSLRRIADLGCGAGNVARLLSERWPGATVVGVDNSATMLERARTATAAVPQITFEAAELDAWQPTAPMDLIYSNAALHWLPDHATLFPRLAAMVAPAGVLAVQMPDNFRAPSHTTIHDVVQSPRWHATLGSLVRTAPTASATDYYAWLAPLFARVDIWTTEYLQVLPANATGDHPVAAWTKGTWLVPFLAMLDAAEQAALMAAYNARLALAYPLQPDGSVLFPFRRLFIIANR
ncbi:MAG: methyltransferase domain-containing protein [Betaproteobacteria bacterium]